MTSKYSHKIFVRAYSPGLCAVSPCPCPCPRPCPCPCSCPCPSMSLHVRVLVVPGSNGTRTGEQITPITGRTEVCIWPFHVTQRLAQYEHDIPLRARLRFETCHMVFAISFPLFQIYQKHKVRTLRGKLKLGYCIGKAGQNFHGMAILVDLIVDTRDISCTQKVEHACTRIEVDSA